MNYAYFNIARPANEPGRDYSAGTAARESLKAELARQSAMEIEIPVIIGGKEYYTGDTSTCVMPHDHQHVLCTYHNATEKELKLAMDAAEAAKKAWNDMPWEHKASIFLKAADLLTGPYRDLINAATMLGQSKVAFQAEIDSACELADFLRYNVYNAQEIYKEQPASVGTIWNRNIYRPLEGVVVAVSPFNFTSIGGNLPVAPATMGNTVIWKPSSTAVLSNYYFYKILEEAGLPAGVINFVPSHGSDVNKYVLTDSRLAGFHFTGSTAVFQQVWETVGKNISKYKSYPRLVGETGGKDFIFAHPTAKVDALVSAMARGAFEYQGQKCSAASRAYIPASLWPQVKEMLLDKISQIKVGDIAEFDTMMGAVIDKKSYQNIKNYVEYAQNSDDAEILCGHLDDSKGYFVYPTVIQAKTPDFNTMKEEIFGPVLTVYVYEDDKLDETLQACDQGSPYALTGAIFAQDRQAIVHMEAALENAAGNFYINDKPTGAVVGQQPFGGSRASGTNYKAGSKLNLYRWISCRVIKENFVSDTAITYPYMG